MFGGVKFAVVCCDVRLGKSNACPWSRDTVYCKDKRENFHASVTLAVLHEKKCGFLLCGGFKPSLVERRKVCSSYRNVANVWALGSLHPLWESQPNAKAFCRVCYTVL